MTTAKDKPLQVGEVVYHITGGERKPGVVITPGLVEVDWGPEIGTSSHPEHTLTRTYVPDYGEK